MSPSLLTLPISPSLPTPLTSLPILQEKKALNGVREEVCNLLKLLGNQVYACHDIKYLQKLRCTLTDESCGMSSILCDHWRKRSTNTTDTPFPKKLA